MPIYTEKEKTYDELQKLISPEYVCGTCAGAITLCWGGSFGYNCFILRCYKDIDHNEISRPFQLSPADMPGFNLFDANKKRRKSMAEEFGQEKTKALAKYIGAVVMTRSIATEIVESLWGAAPAIEKTKCILLCQTYQLNPLMKHIYLIGYKRYKDRKLVVDDKGKAILDWSIQQGIGATRLLAQRKHNYSYMDMSPRRATKLEIDKVFGDEADPESLYAFVHIKDNDTGAEVTACRGIPKDYNIKGKEKGNTLLNQVCIWTERQALDRQYPGEMPDIEVVDERYMEEVEVAGVGKVIKATGEIIESTAEELDQEPEPESEVVHWCEEHSCAFELKRGKFGPFYAHKKAGGGWCNEKKQKAAAAAAEPTQDSRAEAWEKEPEPEPEPVEEAQQTSQAQWPHLTNVGELLTRAKNYNLSRPEVFAILKIEDSSELSDLDEAWLTVAKDKGFNPPEE